MMGNIGPMEVLVVLVIALVVFGPKRLPDLGHSLGKGIREFKGSVTGENDGPAEPARVESTRVETAPPTSHRVEDSPTPIHH
jgi:sec-independent protein translocase protein TatA